MPPSRVVYHNMHSTNFHKSLQLDSSKKITVIQPLGEAGTRWNRMLQINLSLTSSTGSIHNHCSDKSSEMATLMHGWQKAFSERPWNQTQFTCYRHHLPPYNVRRHGRAQRLDPPTSKVSACPYQPGAELRVPRLDGKLRKDKTPREAFILTLDRLIKTVHQIFLGKGLPLNNEIGKINVVLTFSTRNDTRHQLVTKSSNTMLVTLTRFFYHL